MAKQKCEHELPIGFCVIESCPHWDGLSDSRPTYKAERSLRKATADDSSKLRDKLSQLKIDHAEALAELNNLRSELESRDAKIAELQSELNAAVKRRMLRVEKVHRQVPIRMHHQLADLAQALNSSTDEILSATRTQFVARARACIGYFLYASGDYSWPEVGNVLLCDHSTALQQSRKFALAVANKEHWALDFRDKALRMIQRKGAA